MPILLPPVASTGEYALSFGPLIMVHVWLAMALTSLAIGALKGPTLGKGPDLVYPLSRVPTHPLRALGSAARGNKYVEFLSHKYHGLTLM